MTVHLYAQVWNEERILPFFFRHYDCVVDQYFIYDDGSTDETVAILEGHPRVHVERFPRAVPDSFALSEQAHSNTCWRTSRGQADWVIVTDVDEFLYHADLRAYLDRCAREGVTLVPALGFQMISTERPASHASLLDDYPMGAPWAQMMKLSVFAPAALDEMDYVPGRHRAAPKGRAHAPASDELTLLHYKYLGFDATHLRHRALRDRLGAIDLERNYGHKYSWSEEEFRVDWDSVWASAIDTRAVRDDPARSYPYEPWWLGYRNAEATV